MYTVLSSHRTRCVFTVLVLGDFVCCANPSAATVLEKNPSRLKCEHRANDEHLAYNQLADHGSGRIKGRSPWANGWGLSRQLQGESSCGKEGLSHLGRGH